MTSFIKKIGKKILSSNDTFTGCVGKIKIRDRYTDAASLLQKDSPLIVDVGANEGYTVRSFLKYFKNPTIYAFEPLPECLEKLNKAYAQIPQVKIMPYALGADEREIVFNMHAQKGSSSVLEVSETGRQYHPNIDQNMQKINVQQRRLDQCLPPDTTIDLMKLDVQGYEMEVLKGASELLKNTRIIFSEIEFVPIYENQPLFSDIDNYLRSAGFQFTCFSELWVHANGQLEAGDGIWVNHALRD
jgi:FkbM family methyltransferase